jgi:hypothetical protein
MASSIAVQEVQPGGSAAITKYGQPEIVCGCPFHGHTCGITDVLD